MLGKPFQNIRQLNTIKIIIHCIWHTKFTNILGVINFEIDKGSISNLNSQFDESSTMEEKVNMLDGIDLKMNIIPPAQPAIAPVMNNDFKVQVFLWQSLLLSFQ